MAVLLLAAPRHVDDADVGLEDEVAELVLDLEKVHERDVADHLLGLVVELDQGGVVAVELDGLLVQLGHQILRLLQRHGLHLGVELHDALLDLVDLPVDRLELAQGGAADPVLGEQRVLLLDQLVVLGAHDLVRLVVHVADADLGLAQLDQLLDDVDVRAVLLDRELLVRELGLDRRQVGRDHAGLQHALDVELGGHDLRLELVHLALLDDQHARELLVVLLDVVLAGLHLVRGHGQLAEQALELGPLRLDLGVLGLRRGRQEPLLHRGQLLLELREPVLDLRGAALAALEQGERVDLGLAVEHHVHLVDDELVVGEHLLAQRQVLEHLNAAIGHRVGRDPLDGQGRQERAGVEHVHVRGHHLAEVGPGVVVLGEHGVQLVLDGTELLAHVLEHLERGVELAVAQEQVPTEQLGLGDERGARVGDGQHLERALGLRGVLHLDVDPGHLEQGLVEELGGLGDGLVDLGRPLELVRLVVHPAQVDLGEVADPTCPGRGGLEARDLVEQPGRALEVLLERVDDAHEEAALRVVLVVRAHLLEAREGRVQVLLEVVPGRLQPQEEAELSFGVEGGEPQGLFDEPLWVEPLDLGVPEPFQVGVPRVHLPGDVLDHFGGEVFCVQVGVEAIVVPIIVVCDETHLLKLVSNLGLGVRCVDVKDRYIRLQLSCKLVVGPKVARIVFGISADEPCRDYDVVIPQVLHCLVCVVGHLTFAEELEVLFAGVLDSEEDAVESCSCHLLDQAPAGSDAPCRGLDFVLDVVEPGFDYGITERFHPLHVEGYVVVWKEHRFCAVSFCISDVFENAIEWILSKGFSVHVLDRAELAPVGASSAGLDRVYWDSKALKSLRY